MTPRLRAFTPRLNTMMSVLAVPLLASACGQQPKQETQSPETEASQTADIILRSGKIYTADDNRFAQAAVIRGDTFIYVGDDEGSMDYTAGKVVDLRGGLVLPGLIDTHLHPIGAMDVSDCDLRNEPIPLEALREFVTGCLARADLTEGEWLTVELWNYAAGNQPSSTLPTMRAALDAVSTDVPIILLGSDGHHYGVNSVALARAKNADGETVGITGATLQRDFADLAGYFGTDKQGEPDGRITEDYAIALLGGGSLIGAGLDAKRANPEKMMEVTLPRGITGFLDAAADPAVLDIYDALIERDAFHARATLAIYLDPSKYPLEDGEPDYDAMIAEALDIRAKYLTEPNLKADFLKLFSDGVHEGDPLATPPTLPNAASLTPYLQPIFEWDDETDWVKLTGYVSPTSEECVSWGANGDSTSLQAIADFQSTNGFHPAQCQQSNGTLQHPERTILNYVLQADAADFTFMIHAIGDRAVRTALDAIELTRERNSSDREHIVTHLQQVNPDDVARFAQLNAFASFTFAWAVVDPLYDTTVMPFVDRVDGPGGFYNPQNYYMQNVYPAKSILEKGGRIIAGSDAPVDTRDPRPFENIEAAVSRTTSDQPPLNADEALSIFDAVNAYTSMAATALGDEQQNGRIAEGRKADFILVDRDVFELAESGNTAPISETVVTETWFGGRKVYSANENTAD